jgi:hypothetical protein
MAWPNSGTGYREKVEDVDINIFKELQKDDILFIDSSHIIRPQGDVLLEYLEILPQLNSSVLIHVHDICTPKIIWMILYSITIICGTNSTCWKPCSLIIVVLELLALLII